MDASTNMLRAQIIEDSEDDFELICNELLLGGFMPKCVEFALKIIPIRRN